MSSPPLALMVAGTRSGSGKTTLALSLMAALRRRGLTVQAFKAGPDFIDPGHHAALTGRPSCNLDTWMAGDQGVRTAWERLLCSRPQPDALLGEGVMGLFDGAGGAADAQGAKTADRRGILETSHELETSGELEASSGTQTLGGRGSTAHLARLLRLPLLLVVDVRGMGQSAAALAHGFTSWQPELNFAGIVCTHVGGPVHEALLREAFQTVFAKRIPLLGLMPRQGAPELPSRHLGLVMAHELPWNERCREDMALWLEQHLDVEELLARCAALSPPQPPSPASLSLATRQTLTDTRRPRIGIARDEAFCFLYAHMPDVLRELGADCVFFSPLRDTRLPPHCDALYFPGGYPELHAGELAGNTAMLEAVRAFAASGRRIYGECGGYIYLMESVEVQGRTWPMSGCLPLRCALEDTRAALGYREVTPFQHTGDASDAVPQGRGHEFHYCRLLEEPTTAPLWQVRDRKGQPLPAEGVQHGSICASWVHLCPYGACELLAHIFQLPNAKENHAP